MADVRSEPRNSVQVDAAADDPLFEEFQKQLEALDTFREQYRRLYHFAGLERHDPDVQRLLEGLAFFTARTRREARRAVERYELAALQELFPYLLSPLPSMALLVADSAVRLPDARSLPAGTEVRVNERVLGDGTAREFRYRTSRGLELIPIEIDTERLTLSRLSEGGAELTLVLRSLVPRTEELRRLELYLNPQGDLFSAFRLYEALRESLQQVSYGFPQSGDPVARSTRRFRFGASAELRSSDPFANPLEGVRRYLHFPLAAMCLCVELEHTPAEWRELRLRFRLSDRFPPGLGFGPSSFLLHATPMVNLRRELAEPVPFDGSIATVPVRHPEPERNYRVRELLGVYRAHDAGPKPILPGALSDSDESYSPEITGRGDERKLRLDVVLPSAFEQPTQIIVDAEWYQPAAGRAEGVQYAAEPLTRHLEGVRFSVANPPEPASESPLLENRARLERLLRLRARRELDAAGLRFLLETLGAANHELFAAVVRRIVSLSVSEGPDAHSESGRRKVFSVAIKGLPLSLRSVASFLFRCVPELLSAFCNEEQLLVRLQLEGHEHPEFLYTLGE